MYPPSPNDIMERSVRIGELPAYAEIEHSLLWCPNYGDAERFIYAKRFGYGVPCREVIDEVARYGPLLELGAGNGFWSFWLRKKGCDVIATDIGEDNPYTKNKWVSDVIQLDAVTALKTFPGRNILIVWPHFTAGWSVEVVQQLKPSQIICYVGEGPFGCCAPPAFFSELARRQFQMTYMCASPAWPMTTDYLAVYRKTQPNA
jgi:hypothetical protein